MKSKDVSSIELNEMTGGESWAAKEKNKLVMRVRHPDITDVDVMDFPLEQYEFDDMPAGKFPVEQSMNRINESRVKHRKDRPELNA